MKSKRSQYYGASIKTISRTKKLRRDGTSAEKLLWEIIRDRGVSGYKFRRQHPIRYFIVDFYCHEARLVVELDGDIHEISEIKEYDKNREEIIRELGLHVIRFTNEEVFSQPENVVKVMENYLNKL